MRSPRRHLIAAAAALATVLACGSAFAAFPEKTITIVVPTAAGGANDAMARVIGQGLRDGRFGGEPALRWRP